MIMRQMTIPMNIRKMMVAMRMNFHYEDDLFSFVGRQPLVFKPGMPFETQIAVRYSDQVEHV